MKKKQKLKLMLKLSARNLHAEHLHGLRAKLVVGITSESLKTQGEK